MATATRAKIQSKRKITRRKVNFKVDLSKERGARRGGKEQRGRSPMHEVATAMQAVPKFSLYEQLVQRLANDETLVRRINDCLDRPLLEDGPSIARSRFDGVNAGAVEAKVARGPLLARADDTEHEIKEIYDRISHVGERISRLDERIARLENAIGLAIPETV